MTDITIHAARAVCSSNGIDGPATITVRNGVLAQVAPGPASRDQPIDHVFPSGILLPGLIDLHAHPAMAGSKWGVDPDLYILQRGTTTVMSQGDAGARNIDDYVEHTIRPSQTRVILAINLSRIAESTNDGCLSNLDDADADECIEAIHRHRDHIWGISINTSRHCCEKTDPQEVARRARLVAEETGLPLLYGMRAPEDWPLGEQLELLRPGDVVTYCYRVQPHCIVENGRVLPEVKAARERGVLFDVGHGGSAFDLQVAETAIADGFLPDTISSDLHSRHLGQKVEHDLPLVLSKLIAVGMPESEALKAVTSSPARVLGLNDQIGSLTPGTCADLTLLQASPAATTFADVSENQRDGIRWRAAFIMRNGQVQHGLRR